MTIKHLYQKRAHSSVLLFLLLCVVGMTKGYADNYDFSAVCSTGQTLYYRITNTTTYEVELTYPNYYSYSWSISTLYVIISSYWSGYERPTGDIIVPDHVMHSGISYSVTSIRDHTFGDSRMSQTSGYSPLYTYDEGCKNITSIVIPSSITNIGSDAFAKCSGLTSVIMQGAIPPTLGSSAFYDTNDCPIYVPYESLNSYKTATNWSDYEDRIFPMAYKTIPAHGESGGWAFIASPLLANTAPTEIDDMISETESNFDLYRFNQSAELEWENWKSHANNDDHYHFNLKNGQGYLYANAEDVNLIFKGTFNENSTKTINLIYEAGEPFAGWNLVGNPFPVAATVTGSSYYVMNDEGTGLDPTPVSSGGTIPACTGIMVHASVLGQPITFSTSAPETQSQNNGMLQIAVAENARGNAIEDKAVISFNEGDALCKFVFNKDNAQISIPQGGEDYAIACVEKRGEMPLNFKAAKNGSYTLSVNPEAVEMEYLHLVDNLTGNDIDLLVTPSYTFEGKTSDYASRFRLVFSVYEDGDNEEPFAFISNGSIIVTGDYANAMLQIVDLTGRVVVSTEVVNNVSINELASGVYVLRLIDGENVRTQKIVIH